MSVTFHGIDGARSGPLGAVLLTGALLASLAACGPTDDPNGESPGSICIEDSECPGEQVCIQGYCTVADAPRRTYDFQFFPPGSEPLFVPQTAANLSVVPGRNLDVALEPVVSVTGRVELAGSSRRDCVPEQVLVFTRRTAPGASGTLRHSVTASLASTFCGNRTASSRCFDTSLVPGRYDVRFVPGEPEPNSCEEPYPPVVWRSQQIAQNVVPDLEIPNPSELVTIEGNLTYHPAGTEPGTTRPLRRARVYAVGSNDETLQTTTDISEPAEGNNARFELSALPPDGRTSYDLVVGPSTQNQFIPKRRIRAAAAIQQCSEGERLALETDDAPVNLGSCNIGTYPRPVASEVTLRFEAPGNLPNRASFDWRGFRVAVQSRNLPKSPLERSARVDGTGSTARAELELLPVEYNAWLLPPPGSRVRARSFRFDASTGDGNYGTFRLRTKSRLTGRILDAQGDPLAGADVEFRMLEIGVPRAAVLTQRRLPSRLTASAETDEDGNFEVWLERANYRTVVLPPVSTGLPRTASRIRPEAVEGGGPVELRVDEPLLIRGHVYGRFFTEEGTVDAEPLPETRIEARTRLHGVPTRLGETQSREAGAFSLIVPAAAP